MNWVDVLKAPKGIPLPPDEHDRRHEKRYIGEADYALMLRLERAERRMKEKGISDSPLYREFLELIGEFTADPREMYEKYKKEYPKQITRFRDFIYAVKSQANQFSSLIAYGDDRFEENTDKVK